MIGVMPAVQRVSTFPGVFRKMAVYFRIRLPLDQDLNERIFITLDIDEGMSDDVEVDEQYALPRKNLENALARAKERNAPYTEVMAKLIVDGIPITRAGQIRAVANIGGEALIGGYLNIALRDDASASQPPSSQSPPDAPAS